MVAEISTLETIANTAFVNARNTDVGAEYAYDYTLGQISPMLLYQEVKPLIDKYFDLERRAQRLPDATYLMDYAKRLNVHRRSRELAKFIQMKEIPSVFQIREAYRKYTKVRDRLPLFEQAVTRAETRAPEPVVIPPPTPKKEEPRKVEKPPEKKVNYTMPLLLVGSLVALKLLKVI